MPVYNIVSSTDNCATIEINGKPRRLVSNRYQLVRPEVIRTMAEYHGFEARKETYSKSGAKSFQEFVLPGVRIGDYLPRIVAYNDYVANGCLRLLGGLYRLVCSNGMVVSEDLDAYVRTHLGANIGQALDNAFAELAARVRDRAGWIENAIEASRNTYRYTTMSNAICALGPKALNTIYDRMGAYEPNDTVASTDWLWFQTLTDVAQKLQPAARLRYEQLAAKIVGLN